APEANTESPRSGSRTLVDGRPLALPSRVAGPAEGTYLLEAVGDPGHSARRLPGRRAARAGGCPAEPPETRRGGPPGHGPPLVVAHPRLLRRLEASIPISVRLGRGSGSGRGTPPRARSRFHFWSHAEASRPRTVPLASISAPMATWAQRTNRSS